MHFCNRDQTAGGCCRLVDAVVALHVASCVQRMHHLRASAGFQEIRDKKPQNMAVFSCFEFSNGCCERNSVVERPGRVVHPALLSSESNALDSADPLRKGNGGANTSTG